MNKRQIGDKLEKLVVSYLQEIDPKTKQSNNSGAVSGNGDIITNIFVVECKKRNTKSLTINIKTWNKLCNQIPVGSLKIPLLVLQNINEETFAVLNFKDLIGSFKNKE